MSAGDVEGVGGDEVEEAGTGIDCSGMELGRQQHKMGDESTIQLAPDLGGDR